MSFFVDSFKTCISIRFKINHSNNVECQCLHRARYSAILMLRLFDLQSCLSKLAGMF